MGAELRAARGGRARHAEAGGERSSEGRARPLPVLEVVSGRMGVAVVARVPIAPGDLILEFEGPLIDFAETVARGDQEGDPLQLGPDLYLDLRPLGRFVSHSCEPNAGIRDGVRLVALRALAYGETITFDYSTTMHEDHWSAPCVCGTPGCRGVIRDFRWLPRERKLELIAHNVVPAFIVTAELDDGLLSSDDVERAVVRSPESAGLAAAG